MMMKKKYLKTIAASVVLLLFMVSIATAAEFEKVEGDKECLVYQGVINVDGEIDDAWENAPEIPVDIVKENASSYFGDTSKVAGVDYAKLTCKALWDPDSKSIFVLYIVEDKNVSLSASADWEKDSIELFIDYDNIREGAFDTNSFQKRILANESVSPSDATLLKSKVKMTDKGFIVELSHKLADNVVPGSYIGIDFQLNDDAEGNGVRNVCLGWSDSTDQASKDTKVWGQALLSDQVVEGYVPAETENNEPTVDEETNKAEETKEADETAADEKEDDDGGQNTLLYVIIAAVVVVALAIILVASAKKKKA